MPFDGTTTKGATAVKVINLMLEYFGPEGEKWCRWQILNTHGQRCLLGAIEKVSAFEGGASANRYIEKAIGRANSIASFNDGVGYTRNHSRKIDYAKRIKPMLLKARELALNDI